MELSIIIPTFNRNEILEESVENLLLSKDRIDFEIIIVNDNRINTVAINAEDPCIKIYQNPGKGVAAARNFGVNKAKSERLLFLDDDFLISPDQLRLLIEECYNDDGKIVLFNWKYPSSLEKRLNETQFGRFLQNYNYTTLKGWLGKEWNEKEQMFEIPIGASYCLPIKKSVFNLVNGYNENFPHAGAEDYDFNYRLKQTGIRFFINTKIMLFHNEYDRIEFSAFMSRQERAGETFKIASDLGYSEYKLQYSFIKKTILQFLIRISFIIKFSMNAIPNIKIFDSLFFLFVKLFIAIRIFKGYHSL